MKHLIKTRRWLCLATSTAMVCDTSLQDFIEKVGNDGSEILWPDAPFPACHRGHMPNEMVMYALSCGVSLVPVFPTWPAMPGPQYTMQPITLPRQWIDGMLREHDGVLIGNGHSVAWDSKQKLVLDPDGPKYPLQVFLSRLEVFWAKM